MRSPPMGDSTCPNLHPSGGSRRNMGSAHSHLPHDRGHLLWLNGRPTSRLQKSMDRWTDNLLKDDDVTHFSFQGIDTLAFIRVKQKGILAGRCMVDRLLSRSGITTEWNHADGDWMDEGVVATLQGPRETILVLERTLLNILGRLSGIATNTAEWVAIAPCAIACTRKTTWGVLDKWAVHLGGGLTHRLDRNDALMIKENDLAGGASVEETLSAVEPEQWGFVEIEVRSVEEAAAAAEAWQHGQPMVMMLDNMSGAEHAAVKEGVTEDNIILEISGGITLDNLATTAGADVVSASALNQGVSHIDFSMLFEGVE